MDIGRNIGVEFLKNHSGGGSTEIKNTYTKWLDEGRFFLLPNAVFTLGLCPGEMTLYAYLIFCEDRETHQCWPSIGKICQHTGMSANTVAKYIRQLEDKQLMSWANGNKFINGHDDGTIDAGGTAIRAQAASILMRFDQNLVKN